MATCGTIPGNCRHALPRAILTSGAKLQGFDAWLDYAREHGCILSEYDQIQHDLAPFRELPRRRDGRTISRSMLAAAARLEHTAVFRMHNGTVSASAGTGTYAGDGYLAMLAPLAPLLPDMEFVVNLNDEPRVLPGGNLKVP